MGVEPVDLFYRPIKSRFLGFFYAFELFSTFIFRLIENQFFPKCMRIHDFKAVKWQNTMASKLLYLLVFQHFGKFAHHGLTQFTHSCSSSQRIFAGSAHHG